MCGEKNFAHNIFIFAQFLEKIAQKQNMPKFWKNLPNFQKLPNTCSPANVTKARNQMKHKVFIHPPDSMVGYLKPVSSKDRFWI